MNFGAVTMQKFYKFQINRELSLILLSAVEFLLFSIAVYLGAYIRFLGDMHLSPERFNIFFVFSFVFASVMMLSMSTLGMYQHHFKADIRNVFLRLIPSIMMGLGVVTLVIYLIPSLYFGRGILALAVIVSFLEIILTRFICGKYYLLNPFKSRVIVVGCGSLAQECSNLARSIKHHRYDVVGFVSMQDEVCSVPSKAMIPVGESLFQLAKDNNVNEIVVAVQDRRNANLSSTGRFKSFIGNGVHKPIEEMLDCKLKGINVIEASIFFEREANQIRLDSLQPSWLVFGGGFDQSFLRAFIKRIFDILASTILLITMLPIMLITAIAIYLEDRQPVFYQQERVGLNGQSFMVLKFRSMRNDAEVSGQPEWAAENDSRTTKVGRLIRKLRIDEIPQIFNVLKGEMSFVGPRPERPYFVKQLSEAIPYYNVRHSVKPGITGLAQVSYKYGASVDDARKKLQYDLYYVKNNSLILDVLILVDTFQVVLLGKGAR